MVKLPRLEKSYVVILSIVLLLACAWFLSNRQSGEIGTNPNQTIGSASEQSDQTTFNGNAQDTASTIPVAEPKYDPESLPSQSSTETEPEQSEQLEETEAPDITPPTAPMNLNAEDFADTETTGFIQLNWEAAADDIEVAGYKVYKDDVEVGEVTDGGTSFTLLEPCQQMYRFSVKSFDYAGNVSEPSNEVVYGAFEGCLL